MDCSEPRSQTFLEPPKMYFSTCHLIPSADSSSQSIRKSLADISNTAQYSSATAPLKGQDDLSSLRSRLHPKIHVSRVGSVVCHETDTWTREPKAHDTKLDAAVASSFLGSNNAASGSINVAGRNFASMEFQTQEPWTIDQYPKVARVDDRTANYPLVASDSGFSPVRPNGTEGRCSHEDLSEGRRRVGEILVRCGVINVSGMPPIESTDKAIGVPSVSAAPSGRQFHDDVLITALADWTSEWIHILVIQPYLQGNSWFQFYGKSRKCSASVTSRIHRILGDVNNPVQVVIHALWFINVLTGNDTHDRSSFLSIPFFRYLHNNGTVYAEDFMFRTFVACAMIGDKTVNDAALSTNTWNRLTRISHAMLNAAEGDVLSCLKWNVVMTRDQWQDAIVYLRSCIKMGSGFDSFVYEKNSPSALMARYLDELIELSYGGEHGAQQQINSDTEEIPAPQPTGHSAHWEVVDAIEWCPENDPVVNKKPRTIGIAPGSDRNSGAINIGATAKDLLDSILGSSDVADLSCLGRPAGTSFCGSFGSIGMRLAHTVKMARACQNVSWVPSHGYLNT